jgi:carbon-monoxide dehydrogenase medium subunit
MTYHRPTTLGQAKELSQTLENAVFMSGGHTLLPAMKQDLATPDHVIDLSHIGELETIRVDSNDLIIGVVQFMGACEADTSLRTMVEGRLENTFKAIPFPNQSEKS